MARKNLTAIELDLKDWKDVERGCMNAIEDAKKALILNDIMLQNAIVNIKKLNGKTAKEEDDEAREKFAEADRKALENNEPRPDKA